MMMFWPIGQGTQVHVICPPCQLVQSYLQHGTILKDVLLVAHHAVLVERGDPLLRVLHYLSGGEEGGKRTAAFAAITPT